MSGSSENVAKSLGRKNATIVSTATFLVFEPGLYTINFASSSSGGSDVGLRLPSARLEAVAAPGGGQVFVTTVPSGGWLSTEMSAAHVLVIGGRAGALLTIYRSSDAVDMPTVEFRAVIKAKDVPEGFHVAGGQQAIRAAVPSMVDTTSSYAELKLAVHLQTTGEKTVGNGEWCSTTGARDPIEGFQLSASRQGEPIELEYQGYMGKDWLTQWFRPGQYCGSRGLQLPMLGFKLRLPDALARKYQVQYWGVFGGVDVVGPISGGMLCESNQKPLTSMKVLISPAPAEPPAPKPARAAKPKLAPKPAPKPQPVTQSKPRSRPAKP